jgi:membrane protease YdiL (CAAX protease family)
LANHLLAGPPRYDTQSVWPPLVALVAAIIVQAGLQLLGGLLGALVGGGEARLMSGVPEDKRLLLAIIVFLALSQVGVMAFAWWAAGRFGGDRQAVLQLHRGLPSIADVAIALAGLVLVLGTYNLLVYVLRPDLFMADVAPFLPMLQAPIWPVTALAVGIGAPLSEELLFRGFLLSALASWRWGFWPAALAANMAWTSFHLGYSIAGLLEVFIGGLYISWLLWRTGSLWLPIIAHGATNIFFLAIIAIYPFP